MRVVGDLDGDRQIVEQMREHRQRELVGDAVAGVAQHAQRLARPGERWIVGRVGAAADCRRRIDSAASDSSSRVASITAVSSSADSRSSRRSRSA